jgi:glyoxylase-like metal-dependent hydrolase (beta-lactamase superfamily II)
MTSRNLLAGAACAALCLCGASAASAADVSATKTLEYYPVRGGVHMFTGPTGNIVVFTGKDGVMVIDPGSVETSATLLDEIKKLSPDKPIRWVVDTNGSPDHVAANAVVANAGVSLEGGNTRPVDAVGSTGGAPIWAHEGVLKRMIAIDAPGAPSDSYFAVSKDMWVNGEAVQILNASPGVAEGDSFVYLRSTEVIAAGDVYTPERYPQIDLQNGGGIQGVIDGLNKLLRYTVPEFNQEGGTLVVPAHGRISDEADVGLYRDMVTIVRDRIRDMVGRRMTLAQVQAANPTYDYDSVYGVEAGRTFTEAVYRSLTQKPSSQRSAP